MVGVVALHVVCKIAWRVALHPGLHLTACRALGQVPFFMARWVLTGVEQAQVAVRLTAGLWLSTCRPPANACYGTVPGALWCSRGSGQRKGKGRKDLPPICCTHRGGELNAVRSHTAACRVLYYYTYILLLRMYVRVKCTSACSYWH